jgi:hypothetical protein
VLSVAGSGTLALDPAIYLADLDPDAEADRRRASLGEALEFDRQQSKVQPYHEDGKPNRPLIAHTIDLVSLECDGHEHELESLL